MQAAIERVHRMSDAELVAVWSLLEDYDPTDFYSAEVSMDQWATIVYGEISQRGLS